MSSSDGDAPGPATDGTPEVAPAGRQRIERTPGSRRVTLTPAPGTEAEPMAGDVPDADAEGAGRAGPNDERLRLDIPPHY